MKKIFVICVCLIGLMVQSCTKKGTGVINIHGSTTMEPITRNIALAYSKKYGGKVNINSPGSHKGVDSLIDGDCDIAASSAPVSLEEKERARFKGIVLKEFLIAHDMVVPVVHPENPVYNLSIIRLKEIFDGTVKNWKELGGGNKKIHLICRDVNSGTYASWRNQVLQGSLGAAPAKALPSNSAVLAAVAADSGAIGYISFGFLNREVKPVSVNGESVERNAKEAANYPIHRNLYMITREDRFTQEIKSFIIYVRSQKGQELVQKTGFLPAFPVK
ncbi:MAG: phosphate ABC transporter substrate-binding protein [bacterium]|nr:phosphate ABC transporter substrate-binding protein [bacterium]